MAAIQFPIADPVVDRTPAPTSPPEPVPEPEPAPRWRPWLVAAVATMAAIALGGALIVERGSAAPLAPPAASAEVADFATFVTTLALSKGSAGNEATLSPYVLGDLDFTGVPGDQWFVKSAGAVSTEPVADGVWAVTVAVELLGANKGDPAAGYADVGVHHYRVGVSTIGGRLVATGMPTVAAAPPAAGRGVDLVVPQAGSGEAERIASFLVAYLTGVGDVDFSTAEPGLTALDPPPFESVAVRRLGVEHLATGGFLVTAELVGLDAGGRTVLDVQTLAVDAEWRVTAVLPVVPATD